MRRRRGRGGGGLSVLGAVLIACAMLILGGLGGAAVLMRPLPVDGETLCRTDAPIAAHTIVLVDSTDRLHPRHRRKLRSVLAQERARLSQFDRLTVMRISARRPQEPAILFSKCLPRPPEQTNPLFENARFTQQRWDESFAQALDGALRTAASGGAGVASPIIAGVRAVAADPEFGPNVARRRLVLVSDLLEHDPDGFSLYVSDANYAGWSARSYGGPPALTGVDVRIVPLDRPEHARLQSAALAEFWPAFFDAADAEALSVDPSP